MTELIAAALGLGIQILQYINTENSRKYIDQLLDLKQQILDEEQKGYQSDDAKIEYLHQQVKIVFEAAQTEVKQALAKNAAQS